MAHARLEFENGCVANLSASRVSFSPTRRQMHVWAEHAMADIDFGNRTARLVRPSAEVLRHEIDVESMSPTQRGELCLKLGREHLHVDEPPIEARNPLADELQDFVESVRGRRAPRVDGAAGRDAHHIPDVDAFFQEAERVLAALAANSWSERDELPTGSVPSQTARLRGPHWQMSPQPLASHRQAG